ncbi:uncharacterized protein F4817DRAFT_344596 [Daldinia loculata]|uniref:uncharacterized protein n=1 Tax=Daldinia loculata TaxID=103429 RepID=UPI0020C51324|nr:uncharacterized protein F4817DRAFT_344596 [Daldinia loculata]KAI1645205.1 hypothetical protein F4817DRAFT_344596 [Daldinia loculata]
MPPSNDDLWSVRRARETAQEAEVKDKLLMKLKENGILSDGQMEAFKRDVVMHYQEHDIRKRQGRPLRSTRSRQIEIEKTFNDLSLHPFISAVLDYLKTHVSNDRCIQVFEDVISVLPNSPQCPPESKHRNPREKPGTPFSASRANPASIMSNAKLIDALAAATNMEPWKAIWIRGQITWCDSISGSMSGILELGNGLVSYGRLGRDHMLADVPNQYVRDRLMDYIITQLEEDQQECAKKAVFPDLSVAELEQYTVLILKKAEENKPKTRSEMIARIVGKKVLRTESEIERVLGQAYAMDQVDKDDDLTPQPGFSIRNYGRLEPLAHSVVRPGLKELTPEESELNIGTDIDNDCDQIRTMIVCFVDGKGWTADQFRWALGNVSRQQLTTFLLERGPKQGVNKPIFQHAWEFFKKREILGLPLTEVSEEDTIVLQERDSNRANKRQSTDGEGSSSKRRCSRRA